MLRFGHDFRLVVYVCLWLAASQVVIMYYSLHYPFRWLSNRTMLGRLISFYPFPSELETSSKHSVVYLVAGRFCSSSVLAMIVIYSMQVYAQLSASLLETLSRIACAMKTPINSSYIVESVKLLYFYIIDSSF